MEHRIARILFTMTGVQSVPPGRARNNLNALNQITKNLEHPSTKSKCSPQGYGKHAFAKAYAGEDFVCSHHWCPRQLISAAVGRSLRKTGLSLRDSLKPQA